MRLPFPVSVSSLRVVLRVTGLRQIGVLLFFGSISSPLMFSQTVEFSGLKVVVCNDSPASLRTLQLAESSATEILRNAGSPLAWVNVPSKAVHQPGSVCEMGIDANELRLRILWHRPRGELSDTVFGVATFPSTVTLYYEPVDRMAFIDNADHERPVVLGALIAHEIGHLLLGPGSHSATGIMRSQWDPQQIRQAMMGRLSFSAEESLRIQANAKKQLLGESKPLTPAAGNFCSGKQ